ncbi:CotS family spore coat protein [Haloimpatiens sp. FM7330]|uniref:CotS family spore coat protein n=1 Tax=Haloimpatiens sp. FM7330 TaxID=3298610 RepID=UPI003630E2B6
MPYKAKLYNNTKLLSEDNVKKYVLPQYNLENGSIEQIKFKNSEKQRAVYKITSFDKFYCLKKVYYDVPELLFVYSAIEWLYRYNINVPKILPTKNNSRYVTYENMIFILTPWIQGIKCDYDIKNHMFKSMRNLAKMHNSTEKFTPILGSKSTSNFSNISNSTNRRYQKILTNSNLAFKTHDNFSNFFLEHFDINETLARKACEISYSINHDNLSKSLCHLDYVNKNLIFDENLELWVIDFDKCRMDFCVHDMSYFLRRLLRRDKTKWNLKLAINCITEYEKFHKLNLDEYKYLLAYLSFPQKYWRISRDYYNNIKKCNKHAFMNLLIKSTNNEEEQLEFVYNFIDYIEHKFSTKIQ